MLSHSSEDKICWDGINRLQYPPADIPGIGKPKSEEDQVQWTGILESYFQASNVHIPEFSFNKVQHSRLSALYTEIDLLHKLYKDRCLEGSFNPADIKVSETLETVTITHDGKKFVVPIDRMSCKLFIIDSEEKKRGAYGMLDGNRILIEGSKMDQLIHEATHAYLEIKWRESGIRAYDQTKVSASSLLTEKELKIAGLKACSPLSMDMANEMIARAVPQIKLTDKPDDWANSVVKANFALGMNIMDRIASARKNGNQPITKTNFKGFDPHQLFGRTTEWIDEPWAEEAVEYAGKISPWVVLTSAKEISKKPWAKKIFEKTAEGNLLAVCAQAPFLIDMLGADFFLQELDQNPEHLAQIPKAIREKYWPGRKLDDKVAKKLPPVFVLTNPELFEEVALSETREAFKYGEDYLRKSGPDADPRIVLLIAERSPFLLLFDFAEPFMKRNCSPENWESSVLCQQIKASLTKEVARMGKEDWEIEYMVQTLFKWSDHPHLTDLFEMLYKKFPNQTKRIMRQEVRYMVNMIELQHDYEPKERIISLLKKHGIDTKQLKAAIKKRSRAVK